ncbi:MAG: hypothetical protein R3E01_26480 [Pirellulaceae bacterium]|nr:hypothetical protein [Planctomycetales bacterium]
MAPHDGHFTVCPASDTGAANRFWQTQFTVRCLEWLVGTAGDAVDDDAAGSALAPGICSEPPQLGHLHLFPARES